MGLQEIAVCGLSSTGSKQKPEVGFLELGNELQLSAKYENSESAELLLLLLLLLGAGVA
jgi:hypothetical protein